MLPQRSEDAKTARARCKNTTSTTVMASIFSHAFNNVGKLSCRDNSSQTTDQMWSCTDLVLCYGESTKVTFLDRKSVV